MGTTEKQTTGTSLAKAATQDTAISDFRKSSRSFGIIAKGSLTAADTETVGNAAVFDLLAGKLDLAQTAAIFKMIDCNLKREDQNIAREDMAFRLELKVKSAKRQKARRELLER
jgi:hypothetical protein